MAVNQYPGATNQGTYSADYWKNLQPGVGQKYRRMAGSGAVNQSALDWITNGGTNYANMVRGSVGQGDMKRGTFQAFDPTQPMQYGTTAGGEHSGSYDLSDPNFGWGRPEDRLYRQTDSSRFEDGMMASHVYDPKGVHQYSELLNDPAGIGKFTSGDLQFGISGLAAMGGLAMLGPMLSAAAAGGGGLGGAAGAGIGASAGDAGLMYAGANGTTGVAGLGGGAGVSGVGSALGGLEGVAGAGGVLGAPVAGTGAAGGLSLSNIINAVSNPSKTLLNQIPGFSNLPGPVQQMLSSLGSSGVKQLLGGGGQQGGGGGLLNDLLGLGSAWYGGKERSGASKDSIGWMNGMVDRIDKLYAPGSPEHNLLKQEMERKDAAAGRNSQYGPRAVDLAGKITGIKGGLLAQMGVGMANPMAAALTQGADAYSGIPAMLGQMGGGSGGLQGLLGMFNGGGTPWGVNSGSSGLNFGNMSNDDIWDMINGGSDFLDDGMDWGSLL